MRYVLGTGLVVVLVLGVMVVGCGGGAGAEEELPATAVAAADGGTSPLVETSRVTRSTSTPSGTSAPAAGDTGTESVQATSEGARPTEETSARVAEEEEEGEYDIYSVIPRDRIPAILDPEFLDAAEAIEEYNEHEQVLGLSINGDHRAYPLPFLSQHEIVNDVVGGKPVAVTW